MMPISSCKLSAQSSGWLVGGGSPIVAAWEALFADSHLPWQCIQLPHYQGATSLPTVHQLPNLDDTTLRGFCQGQEAGSLTLIDLPLLAFSPAPVEKQALAPEVQVLWALLKHFVPWVAAKNGQIWLTTHTPSPLEEDVRRLRQQALVGLMRNIAPEAAKLGVRLNWLCPPSSQALDEAQIAAWQELLCTLANDANISGGEHSL
jgi:hypothetical protein